MTVVTIQQRRATSTEWSTKNPILKAGEIGFEIDTGKVKCGNGVTPWDELVYISGDVNAVQNTGQSTTQVMSQKAVTDALGGKVDKVTGSGLVKTPPTNGKPQAMLDGDWVDAPTKSIDWVIHNGGALTIDSSMNGKFILVKGDSTLTLDVHSSLPVGFNVTILPDDSKDTTAHTITLDKHTSNTIIGDLTTVTGVCSVALIPSTTIFAVAGSIE